MKPSPGSPTSPESRRARCEAKPTRGYIAKAQDFGRVWGQRSCLCALPPKLACSQRAAACNQSVEVRFPTWRRGQGNPDKTCSEQGTGSALKN